AMNLARLGNKYLAETEPWKLAKTDMERVKTIMNIALQITANLTVVFQPFLPEKAKQIANFLNLPLLNWEHAGKTDLLENSHQIATASILISKIDDAFVNAQVEKLKNTNTEMNSNFPPQKENISFDDFTKMD